MKSYMTQELLIERFQSLRFRISFVTKHTQELEELNDMKWTKRIIEDCEGGIVPDGGELRYANRLWKKYSDNGITIDTQWNYIDSCLKDNRKIEAIKTYRKLHGCDLKEAKDVIDARDMQLKGVI